MVQKDPQLSLLFYLIWQCRRQRISRYSLGLGSRRRLDDVSLELFHDAERYLYLFSVEDRHYTKQNISYETLTNSSSVLSLAKYFEAYLKLKLELSVDYEIAVWTGAKIRKRDSKVQQMLELCEDRSRMLDDGLAGVKRYRIRYSENFEEDLLKSVHPLYKLAAKIARLLIAKLPIGVQNTSNESFNWLLEHVFEDKHFKDGFITQHSTLSKEIQQFREYMESELYQLFQRKQIKDFKLARIKQPPYSSHIEIIFKDDYVKRDSRKCLYSFKTTTTKKDVRRFLSSLVFEKTVSIRRKLLH